MNRIALFVLTLAACQSNKQAESYGYLARLGNDTVSIEHVTRRGDEIVSDEVDRFPRVRRRHTTMRLAADGTIQHLEMDIVTPSEAANERERHVVADVSGDSVHITKRDSTGNKKMAFATGGALTMPHLPMMYSLTDLYFGAALRHVTAPGDSVELRQYYIDREFDRFPLHHGTVRSVAANKADLHHDWLAGYGDATFDSLHHMLTYSGARSTYKVDVQRLATPPELPEIQAIGERFAALETSTGGARQLSVRDTARASVGGAIFSVDYGRPLARGRVLLGDILPFDEVWRTGANAATQFTTSAPVTLAGMNVPAGTYTLWTVPRKDGHANLIVNKQFGQWGTEYDESKNLGKAPLTVEASASPVEKFTISIVPARAKKGTLVLEWGSFR
ncbi:MAG TPA: DUF2911 domain-containing protein, partial [Gemmatimonadaceae bacterium]|nr:DUF2911 domain-containing protein [Gemmatimonadaceae bacterium]